LIKYLKSSVWRLAVLGVKVLNKTCKISLFPILAWCLVKGNGVFNSCIVNISQFTVCGA
jgi:hypothetical protein